MINNISQLNSHIYIWAAMKQFLRNKKNIIKHSIFYFSTKTARDFVSNFHFALHYFNKFPSGESVIELQQVL